MWTTFEQNPDTSGILAFSDYYIWDALIQIFHHYLHPQFEFSAGKPKPLPEDPQCTCHKHLSGSRCAALYAITSLHQYIQGAHHCMMACLNLDRRTDLEWQWASAHTRTQSVQKCVTSAPLALQHRIAKKWMFSTDFQNTLTSSICHANPHDQLSQCSAKYFNNKFTQINLKNIVIMFWAPSLHLASPTDWINTFFILLNSI